MPKDDGGYKETSRFHRSVTVNRAATAARLAGEAVNTVRVPFSSRPLSIVDGAVGFSEDARQAPP